MLERLESVLFMTKSYFLTSPAHMSSVLSIGIRNDPLCTGGTGPVRPEPFDDQTDGRGPGLCTA